MDKTVSNPDGRNIIDYYYYMTNEAIKANLDTKRHNFSLMFCNINGDFNLATGIRVSNAFVAKEFLIYGRKKFDKRGTVGTHVYENLRHVKFSDNLDSVFNSYRCVISIDNVPGAEPIEDYNWDFDSSTLIIFGEEQLGIPQEIRDKSHKTLYIKQYGSVRSLNVGVACGIVAYDWTTKFYRNKK